MSSTSTSVQRADVYSRVTTEIIAVIEQGAGEWRAPWFHNGTSIERPTNVSSGKRYRGINTLALWAAASQPDMETASGAPARGQRDFCALSNAKPD